MSSSPSEQTLEKELGLLDVYAVAVGTTLSSGFFLLPGLAFAEAGPAMILSYFFAALLVVPAMFSMVELSTAMPRAGGAYYFLDRSMGPLVGTIGGVGTWLVLVLKTAFVLIGMGAYLGLLWPELPIIPLAVGLALAFGFINLIGTKEAGAFQLVLVAGLLVILTWFSGAGMFQLTAGYFTTFFAEGGHAFFATAGLVYISYAGLTKITSIAEEVDDPERNLPLGMFLALATAVVVYVVGTLVIVGTVPPDALSGNLTPAAASAEQLIGEWGIYLMTGAALLAFFAAANAGVLSASRYPLAMSRDHLIPSVFRRLNDRHLPNIAIYLTVGIIIAILVAVDPMKIAKLASAFQLLMFSLLCLAVIIMRESQIPSYDPGYHSPFYPWMQWIGVLTPFWIITEMGWLSIGFSAGMVAAAVAWYLYYAKDRIVREGAIYHLFARLGRRQFDPLDRELRGIMKEKGLRDEDPFDTLVIRAPVLHVDRPTEFDEIASRASAVMAQRLSKTSDDLLQGFLDGTQVGATPVTHGVAQPHVRTPDVEERELVIVRATHGVEVGDPELDHEPVYAFFFLVSPEQQPAQHLRILAQIAACVDQSDFMQRWNRLTSDQEVKELILRDERYISLRLEHASATDELIDRSLDQIRLPGNALVALVRRGDRTIIPHGDTILRAHDHLTIIGDPDDIRDLREMIQDDIRAVVK